MTMLSRSEIRSLIRSRGGYTNTRRITDVYLNKEIQTAFGHFWRIVDEAHQGWWDTEGNVTTTANVPYVALPADCKVVKGIDRLDGTDYVEMPQVGLDQRNRFSPTSDKPLAHRLSARGIELYPKPNAVYTLRVTYTPKPPQLSENTQYDFYDGWEDYVIEKVLYEVDSMTRQPLGDREKKLDVAEKALRASSGQRRQSEPEYLRLRELSPIDPYDDGILG